MHVMYFYHEIDEVFHIFIFFLITFLINIHIFVTMHRMSLDNIFLISLYNIILNETNKIISFMLT